MDVIILKCCSNAYGISKIFFDKIEREMEIIRETIMRELDKYKKRNRDEIKKDRDARNKSNEEINA